MDQVEIERGCRTIKRLLETSLRTGTGCLIGRFGTIELECCLTPELSEDQALVLERNAGIFPSLKESTLQWKQEYLHAVKEADCLATGWYPPLVKQEASLLHRLGWSGQTVRLRSLEPYYVDPALRWTQCFAEQEVCVVSSFTETAAQQYSHAAAIWKDMDFKTLLPPSTRWHWVRTGYAPVLAQGRATWMDAIGEDISSWKEAVDCLEEAILATGASIVLLGCGGMAMVVGARLKAKGKICLVVGGAIQVLFGIKGGRWGNHSVIQHFWNDAWVWPSIEETPCGANEVERACYWKPS